MRHLRSAACCLVLMLSATGQALQQPPPSQQSALAPKAFYKPELSLPVQNMPLQKARSLMPTLGADAWSEFFARNGSGFNVYLDPRTGTPTGIQGSVPLIPGDGFNNRVSLDAVREEIGRSVGGVDESVVADLVFKFIADNQAAIGVDLLQLGSPRVTQVAPHLWQVHIPQVLNGVPVRDARVAATISHGNLILLGTESWKNARIDTKPAVAASEALTSGNTFVGRQLAPNSLWQQPTLEIAPFSKDGAAFGEGYGHLLVWSYGFQSPGESERWKVTVDAQTGEVLALEDANHYFDASMKGGVYPSTNIGVCASNGTCGTMQPGTPMPWADTGFASPNNYTDGAGIYNYSSGTLSTTLSGKYVKISDACGAISATSTTGSLDLGGVNNDHDCVVPAGTSAGNTAATRSSFYELNKIKEVARGWLPTNTWLQGQLTANVNINSTCNAFWNGTTVNFYRSGGGCRNTGEIGAVFDHEWGHGIDNFDANGTLSNSSEGYADIAAIYRLQTSCVGYGFFQTSNPGCGPTPDGTGFNQQESQVAGQSWCNLRCSGVRDADWAASAPNTPATPQNFVCPMCSSGTGPCGKQVHCAASPVRQAAWDLVTRDLAGAPFNYDSNTAFMVGNKLFYQGSGNVGTWHACNCTAGTSDGCGATNGYMQWLAADDDNGNLADGTPHMTAIYAAYNRHNIACSTPAPVNAGCSAGPSTAPVATVTAGDSQVGVNWTSVPGANQYWVMKTEGFAGCDFGKARVANVTGTSYNDPEVANGRQYCYSVVAASSNACYSTASACVCTTPVCAAPTVPALATPNDGATAVELSPALDWADVTGASGYEVEVATDSAFANKVASANSLVSSNWTVTASLAANTVYYWHARAANSCGGTSAWSATRSFTTRGCITLGAPTLSSPAGGATGVSLNAALDWSDVTSASGYDVELSTDPSFSPVVRSASSLSTSAWNVTPALSNLTTYYWHARAKDSCGAGPWSTASSFTTTNICTPVAAAYNSTLKAPACGSVCGCDTGATLINGRGTLSGGIEPNQPNTLGASCADGVSGTYHSDESIDRISLKTVDEGTITPGKQVKVDVTVYCWGTSDSLDLYYTTNATTAPTWTTLTTNQACTVAGLKTFSYTLTVGANTGNHAVRAQFRYGGTATSACVSGSYNDRDDLVFNVSAAVAKANGKAAQTKQGRATPTAR
ncbi:endopeptidase [Myxococcaceae bacterium JPH2]|nr:endopeptidase [Myxococcaceae bacterium JPH2]